MISAGLEFRHGHLQVVLPLLAREVAVNVSARAAVIRRLDCSWEDPLFW